MTRPTLVLILPLLSLLLPSCATVRHAGGRPPAAVSRALEVATELLGSTKITVGGRSYRADCSGLVTACYAAGGEDLGEDLPPGQSATEGLWKLLSGRKAAVGNAAVRPGDLAFFHNTYDRDEDGLRDDRFTHVALVSSVDPDGTVHFVHFATGTVRRDVMNLRHKNDARDPDRGNSWNSFLRRGGGKVLAGQLFYRFARPVR